MIWVFFYSKIKDKWLVGFENQNSHLLPGFEGVLDVFLGQHGQFLVLDAAFG
jgi:hypothetical protein